MIEMKCPKCSAGRRVPRDKKNTRLVCRKCRAVFHLSPTGVPTVGDPPVPKNAPKEKVRAESAEGGGFEFGGSLEDMAARITRIKLPRISGQTAGIAAGVIVVVALLVFIFARQSLKTRAEIVGKALGSPEGMKAVMDVTVPETALDVIQWYSAATMRYGELKIGARRHRSRVEHKYPFRRQPRPGRRRRAVLRGRHAVR